MSQDSKNGNLLSSKNENNDRPNSPQGKIEAIDHDPKQETVSGKDSPQDVPKSPYTEINLPEDGKVEISPEKGVVPELEPEKGLTQTDGPPQPKVPEERWPTSVVAGGRVSVSPADYIAKIAELSPSGVILDIDELSTGDVVDTPTASTPLDCKKMKYKSKKSGEDGE